MSRETQKRGSPGANTRAATSPAGHLDLDSTTLGEAVNRSHRGAHRALARGDAEKSVFCKPLDIRHMLAHKAPALDEVLPGLVAGTVGMLAGPGGVGKTMLELQLAVALAAGIAHHDGLLSAWGADTLPPEPQRVVLVAAEEPGEVIWQRLRRVVHRLDQGNDLLDHSSRDDIVEQLAENLVIYALAGEQRLRLMDERLRATLEMRQLMQVCEGARLVILDPLRQLHDDDENSSASMSALVSLFKELARSTGAAVVFAHHTSRAGGQFAIDSADAARGSTALSADVRWQLNLAALSTQDASRLGISEQQRSDYALLYCAKQNYGAHRGPLLVQRDPGGVLQACSVERQRPARRAKR